MNSFAVYRLPFDNKYTVVTQTEGQPEELSSYRQLDGRSGFAFAPFAISDDCPLLLLRPDKTDTGHMADIQPQAAAAPTFIHEETDRNSYSRDFAAFHDQICEGHFRKLVLSRSLRINTDRQGQPLELFRRACLLYPRTFVSLFSSQRSGTWLMATPEILLAGRDGEYATMALAGTMKLTGDKLAFDTPGSGIGQQDITWSKKNAEEQHYVEEYIEDIISNVAGHIEKNGPYTARAGNLVHLRTDFRFTIPEDNRLGDIIERLHPTPAVCGLPKDDARTFILGNESHDRRYYSGFSGPMYIGGDTSLYVSLRCMNIDDNGYTLYAGGGLLRESIEQNEWDETEAKMGTMKQVIANR